MAFLVVVIALFAMVTARVTALLPRMGGKMPYATDRDLPASVRSHLPPHAQAIYRQAFNNAFAQHTGDPRQEEASHRIAWAAVKRLYVKDGVHWVPK